MTPKVAVILRGVTGSGKSTFVNMMRSLPGAVSIHAIDDLHVDDQGNFLWDEENQERLYTLNFANFVKSCAEGTELVICDAINIEAGVLHEWFIKLEEVEKEENLNDNLYSTFGFIPPEG